MTLGAIACLEIIMNLMVNNDILYCLKINEGEKRVCVYNRVEVLYLISKEKKIRSKI